MEKVLQIREHGLSLEGIYHRWAAGKRIRGFYQMKKESWLKEMIYYMALCMGSMVIGAVLVSVSMLIHVVDALCRRLQGRKPTTQPHRQAKCT